MQKVRTFAAEIGRKVYRTNYYYLNIADMKQTLPDIIKENESLRTALLAQEGGIMKYLAEHLDADGTATLFTDYQNCCVENFFESYKWDTRVVWSGEEMRRAALGETEHLRKELRYQRALEPVLAELPVDVTETINDFMELYLTYAYKQDRLRWYPDGLTHTDVYREVIEMYNSTGLAFKCMRFILREHHSNGKIEKTESDLFYEFLIRQRTKQLTLGIFAQMRHAVADMLIGKKKEQCRQMVIDTMEKVRGFSQMIYTDEVVKSLRDIELTTEAGLRHNNFKKMADQRESDGKWLRDVVQESFHKLFSKNVRRDSLTFCFANFVYLLMDVGRIWAAQLLVHRIDMHKLEQEVCCILNPTDDLRYYVDKYYINDLPNKYCVANSDVAKKLLEKMGITTDEEPVEPWDDSHDHVFDPRIDPHEVFLAIKDEKRPKFKSPYSRFFVFYRVLEYMHWVIGTQSDFLNWVNLHWQCRWSKPSHFKFSNTIQEEIRNAPLHEWYKGIVPNSDIGGEYRTLADRLFTLFTDSFHDEEVCRLQDKACFYKKDVTDVINKGDLKHPYQSAE